MSLAERGRFEPLLGLDLGAVRVHGGAAAETLASEHSAQAFTYGNHVVLGRDAQHATSSKRVQVLAHELVHVGQQTAVSPCSTAPFLPRERAPPCVQRLDDDDTSILPAWVSSAASTVVEVGAEAVETVVETGAAAVERLAPGLLDFLRDGGATRLAELCCYGVDALLGRLFAELGEIDFMAAIEARFTQLAADVGQLGANLRSGASAAIGELMLPLVQGLQVWGDPIVSAVQEVSDTINAVYTGVWENLAVPVLDFLQGLGGAVWDQFMGLVTWVWELTEPLRTWARFAWDWLVEQFGLAWDSTSGVLDTLRGWAAEAWTSFLGTIEPIRKPLMVAGGILVLLSPLGPIVVLTEVIPPLWEKITWLWQNWNTRDILVRAQEVLRNDILPGIIGTVGGVIGGFARAAAWFAGLLSTFGVAMSGVIGAFGVSKCLQAVLTYLEGVAAQYRRLAEWAELGFSGLVGAIEAALNAIVAIARPILDFLVRLAMVALNPAMLPVALVAAIWLLCPDELKPPVINFVLGLLIAFISGFPALLIGLGPLGVPVKAAVLGFLGHMRGDDGVVSDDERIAASNKIATLAAGGGLEFVAGFAVGLLEGLVDGIIDPLRMIFLIAKFVVVAAAAIGRAVAPFVRAAVPGYSEALEAIGPRGPPVETDAAAELAEAGVEPVPDEATLEEQARGEVQAEGATVSGLAGLLGAAWDWMLSAAEGLGASLAGWLLSYILLPDYELGNKLGFLAGFVLLQVLIIYFTAGEYAALKALKLPMEELIIFFLRFLDLGGELLSVVGRALKPILAPLMHGVSAAGSFVAKLPFIRGLLEVIERWLGKLARFVERIGGRAESRATTEVAEAGEHAAAQIVRRGEREAVEGAEHVAAQTARRGEREVAETGETVAERASQALRLRVEARAFTEAAEKAHVPVVALIPSLDAWFMPRYRWLTGFISQPLPLPGHFRIAFTSSAPTTFDPDYNPGPPLTEDQLRALLPAKTRLGPARRRALEFINSLPASERQFLLDRLGQLSPEEAGRLLTAMDKGKLDRAAFIELLHSKRTGLPLDTRTPLEEAAEADLRTQFDELLENAPGVRIEAPVTWRVSAEEIQASRGVLKSRMDPPTWAGGNPDLWNPHHVIPVEAQGHEVFNRLRNTKIGWDHNAAVNGFPLPTTLEGAAASGLPVHQITPELLQRTRKLPGIAKEIPRGVITDLRGHPNWNAMVKRDLDELARSNLTGQQLRVAVFSLIDNYKGKLQSSGWIVLF
jgi:hypothetical protein